MTASERTSNPVGQADSSDVETAIDVDKTDSYRPQQPLLALIGSVIAGRYKLREEIGEGGMGSVYLAEQLQPVKRRVALKLIKVGMDSKTVLARFESERQALALMDHPNIAKVLDAGTTETGPSVFRDGARQGDSAHGLLRPAPARAAGTPGAVSPDLLGRAARPSKGDHPPRLEAVEYPGGKPRRHTRCPR